MSVLVTGGTRFDDRQLLYDSLDRLHAQYGFDVLIHGDARGADRLAGEWAAAKGVEVRACPAQWHRCGKAAGPLRNARMLAEGPQLVVAFPGSRGEFSTATQAAAKLLELDASAADHRYNAACVFALAAASVQPAEGAADLAPEQAAQRQAWLDAALAALRSALAAGFNDRALLAADPDLAILHDLPEFQALLADPAMAPPAPPEAPTPPEPESP